LIFVFKTLTIRLEYAVFDPLVSFLDGLCVR
jgi:hypothetical protein